MGDLRRFGSYVRFPEMTWPMAGDRLGELQWTLSYGKPTQSDLSAAASILGAYRQMVWDPDKKRREVIRGIRAAEDLPDLATPKGGADGR
jgi:hypothetical protein